MTPTDSLKWIFENFDDPLSALKEINDILEDFLTYFTAQKHLSLLSKEEKDAIFLDFLAGGRPVYPKPGKLEKTRPPREITMDNIGELYEN